MYLYVHIATIDAMAATRKGPMITKEPLLYVRRYVVPSRLLPI